MRGVPLFHQDIRDRPMLSIGILFSETALAPGSAMLERIWPFFIGLVIFGIIVILFVVLRGEKKGDDSRPRD